MKKKYLFVNGFQKWNSLVYKFYKLYKRMRLLHSGNKLTEREYSRLNEKMKKLYKRLEKMQYKVGIRIAGTALAIMLSASVGQAQNFASPVKLQGISKDINVTGEANPVFADVDGDGDTDLFTGNTYGEILFYNNDGNGVYTAQGNLQADGSDINLGTVASPKFADLDGDGDLDLYIGDTDGKIRYYENDGTGTFSYIGFLQADAIDIDVNGTAKFAFEDIDGDNDLDLFIGDYYSGGVGNKYGYIKYYQNDGNGVFTANGNLQANGSDIHIDSSVNPNVSPAFADTDKDGDSDLYIASDNMNVIYYENDGTGTFAAGTNMQADDIDIHTKFAHPSIDFADINGDGNEDLFIGGQFGFIEYYKNNGDGTFSDESYMQELNTGDIKNRYTSPTFADLDGNGILDLYTGTLRNNLLYFPNDGNMLFGFHTNVKESGKSIIIDNNTNPAFADIDGDGDLDLYIGSDNGNIKYYENNNGEYTLQGNLQADGSDINLGAVIYPTFADFDNDGDLDLFIGENSGNIGYYNNNGSGVFSFVSQIEANGNTIDVGTDATPVFADIDDDGDLDLFVGSNYGDIHYYKNNGSGTLDSIGLLQAGGSNINVTSYYNPTFADIDGDGDLDLFVGNDTGNIYFYKNLSFISNAGEDAEEVCSMSYTLNANEPDPDKTGTWSIVSSNTGTFDDVNSYNAVFTADTEDTYILRWTVSDGSNTVSDDVQIIFSPDAENPTITCVGNQEVNANSNHNYIVNGTEFDPVSTNDNCAVASVMNDINSSTTLAAETLSEGTTTVTWTVYDEAGNSSVCSFDILVNAYVGIKNITGSGIHIFPNPVNDFVTVDINNPANSKNVKIQVCNILGEILIENMVSQNKEKIDLSELKPGMYIVNVLTDNRIFTSKIIKK